MISLVNLLLLFRIESDENTMNISQNEIEKITNIVKTKLPNEVYTNKVIRNGNLIIKIYSEVSLFEINEIQNQIEGWDIFLSPDEDYLELIFKRH